MRREKALSEAVYTTSYLMGEIYGIFPHKIERLDEWLYISKFLKKNLGLKVSQVEEFTNVFIKDFNNIYFKENENENNN